MNKWRSAMRISIVYYKFRNKTICTFPVKPKPIMIGSVGLNIALSFFSNSKENDNLLSNIIKEADSLYEDQRYSDVYNLLSKHKKLQNVEVQWRICRALYKMSRTEECTAVENRAMLLEAYSLMSEALQRECEHGVLHKWMAIVLDAKTLQESTAVKVQEADKVKQHLLEAHRLDPTDVTVLYMLGQWCLRASAMNWLQRQWVALVTGGQRPPTADPREALGYFEQAEQLRPRFYLPNVYMLGKLNHQLGNMYRARYYLDLAAQMTTASSSHEERRYAEQARAMADNLSAYDLAEDAL